MQLRSCFQLLIWLAFFLANKNAEAQIRNLHNVATIIPDSLVKEKLIGGTLVKFVEERYLKEGWNEFSHQPAGFVYVSYKEGRVSGFYISDTSGQMQGGGFLPKDGLPFQSCTFSVCLCRGETECAEMFTTNKEKYNMVCAGGTCFFTRPFDALAYKKEYLKKLKAEADAAACNQKEVTTLDFTEKKVFLSGLAKRKLDNLFTAISKNNCRIEVVAYDVNCIICQQVSWDRTYSVYKYLLNKGIDSSRFILRYEEGANPQVVTIRQSVDWDYPVFPSPPPLPCFSYHGLTKKRCRDANKFSP